MISRFFLLTKIFKNVLLVKYLISAFTNSNPMNKDGQLIKKPDKEMVAILLYKAIDLPVSKNSYWKIKIKIILVVMCLDM